MSSTIKSVSSLILYSLHCNNVVVFWSASFTLFRTKDILIYMFYVIVAMAFLDFHSLFIIWKIVTFTAYLKDDFLRGKWISFLLEETKKGKEINRKFGKLRDQTRGFYTFIIIYVVFFSVSSPKMNSFSTYITH